MNPLINIKGKKDKQIMKKNDKILMISLLSIAVFIMTCIYITRKAGGMAVISINGNRYGEFSLSEEQEIPIIQEDGTYNLVVIEDGTAVMKEASCPDLLCVHQKAIKYTNETIVCLPNKVLVEIQRSEKQELDAVAQ